MLRNLQIRSGKPVVTDYKASAAVSTGMGVVKDYETKTFAPPSAETADDIFLVDKERVPTGSNTAYSDLSDYTTEYNSIAINEFAKLHTFDIGERRAVDQYVSTDLADGVYVSVGTDGKWKKSTVSSPYIFTGYETSDGHSLATIEKLDKAGTNV